MDSITQANAAISGHMCITPPPARECRSTPSTASARTIARAPARSTVERIDGNRIGRVRGAEGQSYTQGVVCAKVAPLRRAPAPSRPAVGAAAPGRRQGRRARAFAPISWDEALDEVAEQLTLRGAAPRHRDGVALLLRRHDGAGAARRHQPAAPRDALFAPALDDLRHADRHRLARRGRRQARRRRARDRRDPT